MTSLSVQGSCKFMGSLIIGIQVGVQLLVHCILNEAPPVGGSKWFAHLPIRGEGGGSRNLMLSSNLLKSKIPIYEGVGGGGWGGGVVEFEIEFKFAKIQNSNFWGGGRGSWNLMLSSNLLKSKIPICGGR